MQTKGSFTLEERVDQNTRSIAMINDLLEKQQVVMGEVLDKVNLITAYQIKNAEAIGMLNTRLDCFETKVEHQFREVDKHFERLEKSIDQRFEQVDKRFEQVDKRFEQVDKRFDEQDKRLDSMDSKMDLILKKLA